MKTEEIKKKVKGNVQIATGFLICVIVVKIAWEFIFG